MAWLVWRYGMTSVKVWHDQCEGMAWLVWRYDMANVKVWRTTKVLWSSAVCFNLWCFPTIRNRVRTFSRWWNHAKDTVYEGCPQPYLTSRNVHMDASCRAQSPRIWWCKGSRPALSISDHSLSPNHKRLRSHSVTKATVICICIWDHDGIDEVGLHYVVCWIIFVSSSLLYVEVWCW